MNNSFTTLVKASISDYEGFYKLRSETKNIAWSGMLKAPDYISFKEWYGRQLESESRTIYLLKTKEIIGYLYADKNKEESIEIAYGISEKYEGQGYATLMIKTFINQEISPPILLNAYVSEENIGSQHVLQKVGFYMTKVYDKRMLPLIKKDEQRFFKWEMLL